MSDESRRNYGQPGRAGLTCCPAMADARIQWISQTMSKSQARSNKQLRSRIRSSQLRSESHSINTPRCFLEVSFLNFRLSSSLPTHRVIRGTPANLSGSAPRRGLLRLAGCAQLLAAPSGGRRANVSGLHQLHEVLATEGIGLHRNTLLACVKATQEEFPRSPAISRIADPVTLQSFTFSSAEFPLPSCAFIFLRPYPAVAFSRF